MTPWTCSAAREWRHSGDSETERVVLDLTTYNAAISACEAGKQPERALELFEALQRRDVVPGPASNTSEF